MTSYPGTLDSFSNPTSSNTLDSPDHAGQHSDTNDAIEAIQSVLGTTAGTSVLKDFAAGQFPARVNSGGTILQLLTGGTINQSTFGSPTVTSGTLNQSVMGSPTITGGTQNLPLVKTHTTGSAVYSGTVANTVTLDLANATRHLVNMPNSAGSVTLAITNVTANQPFLVEVLNGTAGLGTIGWFSTIRWGGGTAPIVGTAISKKDTFGFIPTGTATFDGYIVGTNL